MDNEKLRKKLDVLFINLPSVSPELSDTDDATSADNLTPPLGLMYLANSSKDREFTNSYKCVDFAIHDYKNVLESGKTGEFVSEELINGGIEKPDVVAVSLMFSSSYDFFRLVLSKVKKIWPETKVIIGGVHASNTIDYLLKNDRGIDYIVCGEGEGAFVEFLEMVSTGTEINIKGVHSLNNIKKLGKNLIKDNTHISYSHSDRPEPEDKYEKSNYVKDFNIDFTAYPDLINMDKYSSETALFSLSKTTSSVRAFSIMASRGCPYSCTFCASASVHGRMPRWRDLKNVEDEIYWLNKTYGVTKFYLIDDNYVPKKKAVELFNLLSTIKIENFEIVIQNMSINATDHDIIDAIVSAGINNIAFAIESGSKETQARIKKNVKLEKAIDLVSYSQKKGLNVRCFYIIGFPGESLAEMRETFEYAKRLGADWSTFSVASPIPGTVMYDEFVNLGYIEDGPHAWTGTTIRDRVFDTKEINKNDIKDLAYRGNLDVNFVNNLSIKNGDLKNAETIFKNFVKSNDFHIFAYDCLRRIYKANGSVNKENKIIDRMKLLMEQDKKAQSFTKYFDLLDKDIQNTLSPYA